MKILVYDIEIMADDNKMFGEITRFWNGAGLKGDISTIINFGYKWIGDKGKAKCINSWDYPKSWVKSGDRYQNCDKAICKEILKMFHEADVIVAHYGNKFDRKFINARLMAHGLGTIPRHIPQVDTWDLARRHLGLKSNRLDNLAKQFGVERKMDHGMGWRLWEEVRRGKKKYMRLMTRYCAQDVDCLEQVFHKLRHLAANIPHANKEGVTCASCGSTHLQSRGVRRTKAGFYDRYKCQDCGSWNRGPKLHNNKPKLRGI